MSNMKKLFFSLMVILPIQLNGQSLFNDFLDCFSETDLPFVINGRQKKNTISDNLVLEYICDGDTSCLKYEYKGINADTREIVYVENKHYKYHAFCRFLLNDLWLLIYTGYTNSKGYPDYTSLDKIGIYTKTGIKMYEMDFSVFDHTGELEYKEGKVLEDSTIEITIQHKEMIDGKTKHIPIKERYVVNEETAKFELVSRDTIR